LLGIRLKQHETIAASNLSRKLGIASSILAAVFLVSPFGMGWIFAVASVALGILAARRGSKWWLVFPSSNMLMYVFIAAFVIIGRMYHLVTCRREFVTAVER
jgi:hypothetical protein